MPRMRHPKIPGAQIDVAEQAMSFHAVSGWLSDEEWRRAGHPEAEPEADEAVQAAEQDSKPSRRSRPRASSEGRDD